MAVTRKLMLLLVALLLLPVFAACGAPEHQTYSLNETGSSRHLLTCDTLVGDVITPLTYTVTKSIDPVAPGGMVTYEIVAPLAQVDTPIPATFVSSEVTFRIPEGLAVLEAEADSTGTTDFTSASAEISNGRVVLRMRGSFVLDETTRQVPVLRVRSMVTAPSGSTITWNTPELVVGVATVDIFGEQVTRCHFEKPGAIAVTEVL